MKTGRSEKFYRSGFGSNILRVGLLGAVLLSASACTEKAKKAADENQSAMTLSLPSLSGGSQKIGAMNTSATHQITRVMINVSGSDMPPLFWVCDLHEGQPCPQNGGQVSLIAPRGSGRLIQVMLVLESSTGMTFNYGEVTRDFDAAEIGVAVPLVNVGASNIQGKVAGRYIGGTIASPEYPTGPMHFVYTPPGRSAMLLDRTGMYQGWFEAFYIPGNPNFFYTFANGTPVEHINDAIALPDSASLGGATAFARFHVPAVYRCRREVGSVTDCSNAPMQPSDRTMITLGFFGPGVDSANHKLCLPTNLAGDVEAYLNPTATSVPVFVRDTTSTASPALTQIVTMSARPSTEAQLTQLFYHMGGTTSCSGGQDYVDRLRTNVVAALEGEPLKMLKMEGPFEVTDLGFGQTGLGVNAASPSGISISGTVHAGIDVGNWTPSTPNKIALDIFYKTGGGFISDNGDIKCENLASLGYQRDPSPHISGGPFVKTGGLYGSLIFDNTDIVVCPYIGSNTIAGAPPKRYINAAAVIRYNRPMEVVLQASIPATFTQEFQLRQSDGLGHQCRRAQIHLWGAGGGRGAPGNPALGGKGGGGGHAFVDIPNLSDVVKLQYVLGSGGAPGPAAGQSGVAGGATWACVERTAEPGGTIVSSCSQNRVNVAPGLPGTAGSGATAGTDGGTGTGSCPTLSPPSVVGGCAVTTTWAGSTWEPRNSNLPLWADGAGQGDTGTGAGHGRIVVLCSKH